MTPRWIRNSAGAGWRQVGEFHARPDRVDRAARPRDPVWSPVGEAFVCGLVLGVLLSVWLVR